MPRSHVPTTGLRHLTSWPTGLAAVALLTVTACGSATTNPAGAPTATPPSVTTSGDRAGDFPVTPGPPAKGEFSEADVAFVEHLIQHHRQALELCRLTRQHSRDPAVLKLADQIRDDQTGELATLTGWLIGWSKPVPEGLGGHLGAHSDEVVDGSLSEADWQDLHATPASELEAALLRYLQLHNTGTVIFAGSYLDDTLHPAANPEVKTLATRMQANRRAHNRELKAVLSKLPRNTPSAHAP